MLFAGFNVSKGEYSIWTATLVASLANVVGLRIAYAVGYYGRVDILEKHGKKLHISPKHLAWADRWFERYGDATVFFTRLLPIIRTFISLPAGVARMPFWRFTLLTFAGCVPWMLLLTFIGVQVGENWREWKDYLHYVDYAVAAVILGTILYLTIRWWRNRGKPPNAESPSTSANTKSTTESASSRPSRRAGGPARARGTASRSPRRRTSPSPGCSAARRRIALAVALHAGTSVGLAVLLRRDAREVMRPTLLLAAVPPAVAGTLAHRAIEDRFATPRPWRGDWWPGRSRWS